MILMKIMTANHWQRCRWKRPAGSPSSRGTAPHCRHKRALHQTSSSSFSSSGVSIAEGGGTTWKKQEDQLQIFPKADLKHLNKLTSSHSNWDPGQEVQKLFFSSILRITSSFLVVSQRLSLPSFLDNFTFSLPRLYKPLNLPISALLNHTSIFLATDNPKRGQHSGIQVWGAV